MDVNDEYLYKLEDDFDCMYLLEKPIGNSLENSKIVLNRIEEFIPENKIYLHLFVVIFLRTFSY